MNVLLLVFKPLFWASYIIYTLQIGDMELVLSNMSLAQAQSYIHQSITIFIVLNLLITGLQAYSGYAAAQLVSPDLTRTVFALWVHLLSGVYIYNICNNI